MRINFKKTLLQIFATCILTTSVFLGCIKNSRASGKRDDSRAESPRLVVLLIVDQMRADFLDRFSIAFKSTSGGATLQGLSRLKNTGFNFTQARTASAPTLTAAGHATLCSGATASKHGIVSNFFFDRNLKSRIEMATDATTKIISTPGLVQPDPLSKIEVPGSSHHHFLTSNLADTLFTQSGGKAKTLSISIKDRGAVFCGGSSGRGTFWYDYRTGGMVTSSKYTNKLPQWVDDFNRRNRQATSYVWKPLIGIEQMRSLLLDDKYKRALTERSRLSDKFGAGFPYSHDSASTGNVGVRKFFEYTPFASDFLVDFALSGLEIERLGCDVLKSSTSCAYPPQPDLLTISFSSTDLVGHAFGPESAELMDIYIQLNLSIERLLSAISKKFGERSVLFVLSADHGAQNMPEVIKMFGQPSGRISPTLILTKSEKILDDKFGQANWIEDVINNEIYINHQAIKSHAKSPADIWNELRASLRGESGVRGILSREDILAGQTEEAEFFKRGHHPARSGDAVYLVEPGWYGDDTSAGSHGTSNDEDARIPLIFYGWKIQPGQSSDVHVRADDVAPTILELVGGKRGSEMTGISRLNLIMLQ